MGPEERLREGLSDLAERAGWIDLNDRVLRKSRRMARRRRIATALAVAAAVAAAVPVALLYRGSAPHTATVGDAAPGAGRPASASATATPSTPGSAGSDPTGCPVTATTLLATLPGAYLGGTDVGHPTGLSEVTCYGRYATAYPEPRVGQIRILFGYQLPDRTWLALNAGITGLCESYLLDGSTSSHLPGC